MIDHDLAHLSAVAVCVRKQPGQRILDEGQAAGHFFTISSGTARLSKALPDGREQVTSFAGRGDFLGLALSSDYAYSAVAIDAVSYCQFSRSALRLLIADFPRMEKRLLEITCNELVLAQQQMLLLGQKSARERVASFLIQRVRKSAITPACGQAVHVSLPMTRSDIAAYLGLRIETVSRTLTRMRLDGLIRHEDRGSGVIVIDLSRLDACSMGA